jgi:hypothetical protein
MLRLPNRDESIASTVVIAYAGCDAAMKIAKENQS